MSWYEVLIPAVLAGLMIRLDGFVLGPYWAFSELVPGMGGTDADLWLGERKVQLAVFRRFLYPALAVGCLSILNSDIDTTDAAVIGAVTAGLLLWPMVFHGLPLGVTARDWRVWALYGSVVVGFLVGAVGANYAVQFAREQSNGDLAGWAWNELVKTLISVVFLYAVSAFYGGRYGTIKERKRKRDARGYERR